MKISQIDEGLLDIFKKGEGGEVKAGEKASAAADKASNLSNYRAPGTVNSPAPITFQNQGPKSSPGAKTQDVKVTQTTKPGEKQISTQNERVPPQIKAQMEKAAAEKAAAEKAAAGTKPGVSTATKTKKPPVGPGVKTVLATGAGIGIGAAGQKKDSSDTTKGGTTPDAPKGDGTIKDPSKNSPFHPSNTGGNDALPTKPYPPDSRYGKEDAAKAAADAAKATSNQSSSGYKGSAGSQAIQALNPEIADVNKIRTGQELKMPDGSTYTVQKGDALDRIARNAGLSPRTAPSEKPADKPSNDATFGGKAYSDDVPISKSTSIAQSQNDPLQEPQPDAKSTETVPQADIPARAMPRDYSTGRAVDKELDDKYGQGNERIDDKGRTYVRQKGVMGGPDSEQRSFDSFGSWFNALTGKGDVNGKVTNESLDDSTLNTIKKLSSIKESTITQVDKNMDFRKLLAIMSETKMADLKGTKHSGKYGTEHDTDEEGEEKKRGGQESDATKDSKKWQGAADAAKLVSGGKSKKVDETKMADLKGTKHTGKYGNSYNTDEEGNEKKHSSDSKKKSGTPQVPALKGMSPLGLKASLRDWVEATEAALQEGAKPDFLDMDKDGDKKEPMKKAVADKKNMKKTVKKVDEEKFTSNGKPVSKFEYDQLQKAAGKQPSPSGVHENLKGGQKKTVKESYSDSENNITDILRLAGNRVQSGRISDAIILLSNTKINGEDPQEAVRDIISQLKSDPDEDQLYDIWHDIEDLIDALESDLNEELKGGQKKLDKNKNGKLDGQDFKMLRKSKVDEGVNLHKMMTEKQVKVDEMLEELQKEIAEFKATGEMGDKLRDALDLHTYTKGATLIGEGDNELADKWHDEDMARLGDEGKADAQHMQDLDRSHDESTADLWRMKDLARDKTMGRADAISLREEDHAQGDTVYHRGQIGIVDRIEGNKCFVHKPNGDMDVWPTEECSKKKQGAFDMFKKDVQDVGAGFGRFLKGKSELDESPFTFESKKVKEEEDQPRLKTTKTDTGSETTSSTGRIKATFEPGKETKVEPVKESFVYDVWNHQLEKMISESMINESLTVTTTKGDNNGTDDSVSVTASGNDASEIMAILRNAGIGNMGAEEEHTDHPTSAYGAPEGESVGIVKIDGPEVVDGGDTMLNLMKKIADINNGNSEHQDSDYADENCGQEEVDEGNAFSGAVAKAKATGQDKFNVGGNEYEVQEGIEDILQNILPKSMQPFNTETAAKNAAAARASKEQAPVKEGNRMCSECGTNMYETDCGHRQMVDEDDVEDAKVGIAAGSPAIQAAEPAAPAQQNTAAPASAGGYAQSATKPDTPDNSNVETDDIQFDPTWGGTKAGPDTRTTMQKILPNVLGGKSAPVASNPNAKWDNASQSAVSAVAPANNNSSSYTGAAPAKAQDQNVDANATAQRDQLQKDVNAGKSVASTNIAPSQINPAVLGKQAGATTKATGKVSYAPNAGGVTKTASANPAQKLAAQNKAGSKIGQGYAQAAQAALAEGPDIEFAEVGLEEDAEYANSDDDAALQDIKFMTNYVSGGLNGQKTMHKHGYQNGDNPLAIKEAMDPLVQWKKLSGLQ
jgi:hypothetical protein